MKAALLHDGAAFNSPQALEDWADRLTTMRARWGFLLLALGLGIDLWTKSLSNPLLFEPLAKSRQRGDLEAGTANFRWLSGPTPSRRRPVARQNNDLPSNQEGEKKSLLSPDSRSGARARARADGKRGSSTDH